MRKWLARRVLAKRYERLEFAARMYEEVTDRSEIEDRQLMRFNKQWCQAWKNIPFYFKWRSEHDLPDRIQSIEELREFPELTKYHLTKHSDLVMQTPNRSRLTLTGGTSGVTTAFPMNHHDANASWINTHLGRRWNGLEPMEPLLMIWGHSHLFGGGIGAHLRHTKRKIKDCLVNIERLSAYNLTQKELLKIVKRIHHFRPKFIIGYGSCLVKLCNFVKVEQFDLGSAGVLRIINTSEPLSIEDALFVNATFDCPVINEYGMAEAGVVGYSKNDFFPISLFWNDFLIRHEDRRLLITTLGERCFPLINYDTEDFYDDGTEGQASLLTLNALSGKKRDVFQIPDLGGQPQEVSVVLFDHILKQIKEIRSITYGLRDDGAVVINYTSDLDELNHPQLSRYFVNALSKENIKIDPKKLMFRRVVKEIKTLAGKRLAFRVEA